MAEHFHVPQRYQHYVRGMQDEIIKGIEQETGAKIKLPKEDKFIIAGEKDKVDKALKKMRKIYEDKIFKDDLDVELSSFQLEGLEEAGKETNLVGVQDMMIKLNKAVSVLSAQNNHLLQENISLRKRISAFEDNTNVDVDTLCISDVVKVLVQHEVAKSVEKLGKDQEKAAVQFDLAMKSLRHHLQNKDVAYKNDMRKLKEEINNFSLLKTGDIEEKVKEIVKKQIGSIPNVQIATNYNEVNLKGDVSKNVGRQMTDTDAGMNFEINANTNVGPYLEKLSNFCSLVEKMSYKYDLKK